VLLIHGVSCGKEAGKSAPDATADARQDSGRDASPSDVRLLGLSARPVNTTCVLFPAVDRPAGRLSESGCVDPSTPTTPAAGMIPYDVASPLWSDGAAKERYLALPEGQRIHVKDCAREPASCSPAAMAGTPEDPGHFALPVGTVLMKTFSIAGKPIETRLLMRFGKDTWAGYSYEWDDDQGDAVLLPDSLTAKEKTVANGAGTQTWYFPTRPDCLRCHVDAAGVSLGLEVRQLNREFLYPSGIMSNQLETLEAIGVFDAPLTRPYEKVLPLPNSDQGSLTERARSYMHANCAICHRPESNFPGFDLRFQTDFRDTRICNASPEKGDLGVTGALLLIPGKPEKSLFSLRMHAQPAPKGEGRMPQLATNVVDTGGVSLVDAWIRSLGECP
jgi:hypothetical protein